MQLCTSMQERTSGCMIVCTKARTSCWMMEDAAAGVVAGVAAATATAESAAGAAAASAAAGDAACAGDAAAGICVTGALCWRGDSHPLLRVEQFELSGRQWFDCAPGGRAS